MDFLQGYRFLVFKRHDKGRNDAHYGKMHGWTVLPVAGMNEGMDQEVLYGLSVVERWN